MSSSHTQTLFFVPLKTQQHENIYSELRFCMKCLLSAHTKKKPSVAITCMAMQDTRIFPDFTTTGNLLQRKVPAYKKIAF